MSLTWHASEANAKASTSAITTSTVYDKLYARLNFNDNDVRAVYIDWGDGDNRLRNEKANYQWKTFDNPVSGAVIEHTYTATGADYTPIIQTVNSEGFVSRYHMDGSNPDSLQLQPFTNNSTITGMAVTDGQSTGILRVHNHTVLDGIDNSTFDNDGPADLYLIIPPLQTITELGYFTNATGTGHATGTGLELQVTAEVVNSMLDNKRNTVGPGAGKEIITFTKNLKGPLLTGTDQTAGQNAGGLLNINDTNDGKQISRVLEIRFNNPKYVGNDESHVSWKPEVSNVGLGNYAKNDVLNRLKIMVVASGSDRSDPATTTVVPVGYVTAGCPIKKANDKDRIATLDFSQSRAAASNVSNHFYRFDEGKGWFSQNKPLYNTWNVATGSTAGVYEFFDNQTRRTGSTHQITFSYGDLCRPDGIAGKTTINSMQSIAMGGRSAFSKWWTNGTTTKSQKFRTDQFIIDEFGAFVDQYHLTRCTVQPSGATDITGSTISSLTSNKPYVFRVTPAYTWATSGASVYIDNAQANNFSASYTEAAFNNDNGRNIITEAIQETGLISLSGMNSQSYTYPDGSAREASPTEYLLLLFPKKTNKLFFNINNWGNMIINQNLSGNSFGESSNTNYPSWSIAGVSYLRVDGTAADGGPGIKQNAEWVSVPFEDTTKVEVQYRDTTKKTYVPQYNSLSRSGYLGFDMPLDWTATSLTNLCGGVFNTSAMFPNTGAADILITGTCGTANNDSVIGEHVPLTLDQASTVAVQATNGLTPYDFGNFKYAFFCSSSTGDGANRMYPIASGANTSQYGYASGSNDGVTKGVLALHFGEDLSTFEPDGTLKGYIRRINIYDVLDGFNMLSLAGSDDTALVPVGYSANFLHNYMIKTTGSGIGKDLIDAWKTDDLYAVRIALSGTIADTVTDQEKYAYPQIWNIFDATEGNTALIKSVDDSAYNLNSLAVSSDLSIGRTGQYLTTITRKGKVVIEKTGVGIENLGFSSVALGDEYSDTAFTDSGYDTLYGHLHKIRRIQAAGKSVFWDEIQKDGTFVRFWGVITNLVENHATGGPTAVKSYNFNMTVTKVTLLNSEGYLMTDIFPLGGIDDAPRYTSRMETMGG